jgi:hypothetical protein
MRILRANSPQLANGLNYPPIPTLPAETANFSYVSVMGTKRMLANYFGYVAQLYCATATPTTYDVPQDALGNANVLGVKGWAAGGTVYVKAGYEQKTGNLVDIPEGKRPLYDEEAFINGTFVWPMGWNVAGGYDFDMGVKSSSFSIDRADCGLFVIMRHNPTAETKGVIASLTTSAPARSLTFKHTPYELACFGSATVQFSGLFAPSNKLAVYGVVSDGTKTVLHLNDESFEGAAQTSETVTQAWIGSDDTGNGDYSNDHPCGLVVTDGAPNEEETAAIIQAGKEIFKAKTSLKNRLTIIHHSLAMEYTGVNYGKSTPFYLDKLLNRDVHVNVVAEAGRTLADQYNNNWDDVLQCYDADAITHPLLIHSAINDVNSLSNGFANGDATTITNTINSLRDLYLTAIASWLGQGSNAAVGVALQWQLDNFFTGTAQTITDKTAVMEGWNAAMVAAAAANNFTAIRTDEMDVTGRTSDPAHLNALGCQAQAVLYAGFINPLIAPAAPDKITGVSIDAGDGTYTATLTPPKDNNSEIYLFESEYRLDATGTYSTGATSSTPTIEQTGLTPNALYGARFRCRNGIDAGPWSDEVTFTASSFTLASPGNFIGNFDPADAELDETDTYIERVENTLNASSALTSSGVLRPTLTTIDGNPFFHFDGSQLLEGDSSLFTIPETANTAIVVYKQDTTTGQQRMIVGKNGSAARYLLVVNLPASGDIGFNSNPDYDPVAVAPTLDTGLHIALCRRLGSTIEICIDGTHTQTLEAGADLTLTSLFIGADSGGGNGFIGAIGQLPFWKTRLSNSEANQAIAQLKLKYSNAPWTNI